MAFYGYCPNCARPLQAFFSQPPDHLSDQEYDQWMEDHEDDGPSGVECIHCGYRDDE